MRALRTLRILTAAVVGCLLAACSATRHVPQGAYLLDKVSITVVDSVSNVSAKELRNYIRQQPNHKVLGLFKLQLGVYNISGRDSTKWYNRWVRKIGEEPVVFDDMLTDQSARQLRQALINRGFNDAYVEVDTLLFPQQKKANVAYRLYPGRPFVVKDVTYEIADSAVEATVMRDSMLLTVGPGSLLDRNELDVERTLITERLRNQGYYAFNKEYITYEADTVAGSKDVRLHMRIASPEAAVGEDPDSVSHKRYFIRNVTFVTNFNPGANTSDFNFHAADTVDYKGIKILYGADHYLRPATLYEKCYLRPGDQYRASAIDRTYEGLNQLGIIRYTNIALRPAGRLPDGEMLDVYILLARGPKQGVTLELEGTNSEGDLGFGVGLTYQHRNLAHGSELLTAKFRSSYESLSGDYEGFINNRYTEFASEVGITFPKFQAPFLSRSFKQRMKASTEFAVSFSHQERPEYTRIISGAAWKYKWANRTNTVRRQLDLIDVNFVYLPKSTIDFVNNVAPNNPLLRYSYEDHFIMRIGYAYYRTNRAPVTSSLQKPKWQANIFTIRASAESAGSLLYAMSHLFHQKKEGDAYKLFGIQYAQYFKAEGDFSLTHRFTDRNSLSIHVGGGVAVPYGNSEMVPFEKRFYAGGANSVRGWGVRTLGPGSYDSRNSVTDFINQCGDIRFDLSLEYRNKLFWVFEGALFVDAGNIWTIRHYPNQPGGEFSLDRFYKEIALAYGCGLRLDFTYFLLRLDLGFKAYNPAVNQEKWPLLHPSWHRDANFHFSVGYPF